MLNQHLLRSSRCAFAEMAAGFYGGLLAGALLDISRHQGVVAYEPTELYLTARARTPLAEIESLLADQRQMLAFEPPGFRRLDFGRLRGIGFVRAAPDAGWGCP